MTINGAEEFEPFRWGPAVCPWCGGSGTAVGLLDRPEGSRDWDLIDGGELRSVAEWVAEWSDGAEAGDRDPVVTRWQDRDGRRSVVALNEAGRPTESVGVLARKGCSGVSLH